MQTSRSCRSAVTHTDSPIDFLAITRGSHDSWAGPNRSIPWGASGSRERALDPAPLALPRAAGASLEQLLRGWHGREAGGKESGG